MKCDKIFKVFNKNLDKKANFCTKFDLNIRKSLILNSSWKLNAFSKICPFGGVDVHLSILLTPDGAFDHKNS